MLGPLLFLGVLAGLAVVVSRPAGKAAPQGPSPTELKDNTATPDPGQGLKDADALAREVTNWVLGASMDIGEGSVDGAAKGCAAGIAPGAAAGGLVCGIYMGAVGTLVSGGGGAAFGAAGGAFGNAAGAVKGCETGAEVGAVVGGAQAASQRDWTDNPFKGFWP